MPWVEQPKLREVEAKTWRDGADSTRFHREQVLRTPLHYESVIDSGFYDTLVDFDIVRVINAQLDGWRAINGGWHYALGQPGDKSSDGWVGFGGRQGQNWLEMRLRRVGYLHWPTRAWQNVPATFGYDRANLTKDFSALTVGPAGAEVALNAGGWATWGEVFTEPGGGQIDVTWRVDGTGIKEEIYLNQTMRQWIKTNHPPTTALSDTYFGFLFVLDISDIPKWVKGGVLQDPDTGFDDADGVPIELRDDLDRLLGLIPVGHALSDLYGDGEQDSLNLRHLVWKDGPSYYLLIGARADHFDDLHAGGITFDPQFESQPDAAAGKDTYQYEFRNTRNYGVATTLLHSNVAGNIRKPLIEFDLSSIPAGATCTGATLYLYVDNTHACTFTVYAIAVGNDGWPEGTKNNGGGVAGDSCWDFYDQTPASETSWAGSAGLSTSGTDFEAASIGSITNTGGEGAGDEKSTALTASRVEGWFGPTNTNYGMLCVCNNVGNSRGYRSSDHATAGTRPKIVVDYVTGARHPVTIYQIPAVV